MNCFFKFLSLIPLLVAVGYAAPNYDDAVWDPYRVPGGVLRPAPIKIKNDKQLTSYSMGDEDRFSKHGDDLLALFAMPDVLHTWGGINTRDGNEDENKEVFARWKVRAASSLPSWRLVYDDDQLVSAIGAYIPLYKGSPYDGGVEIAACTHPEYWRQGVAKGALLNYLEAELLPCPKFSYLWASADLENQATRQGLETAGFESWAGCNLDDLDFPGHGRKNRVFYRLTRDRLSQILSGSKK